MGSTTTIALEIVRGGLANDRVEIEVGASLGAFLDRANLLDPACAMCRANLAAIAFVLAATHDGRHLIPTGEAVTRILSRLDECGHPLCTRPAPQRGEG